MKYVKINPTFCFSQSSFIKPERERVSNSGNQNRQNSNPKNPFSQAIRSDFFPFMIKSKGAVTVFLEREISDDDPVLFFLEFKFNFPTLDENQFIFAYKFDNLHGNLSIFVKLIGFLKIKNLLKSFLIFPHNHFGFLEKFVSERLFMRQCALFPLKALFFQGVFHSLVFFCINQKEKHFIRIKNKSRRKSFFLPEIYDNFPEFRSMFLRVANFGEFFITGPIDRQSIENRKQNKEIITIKIIKI